MITVQGLRLHFGDRPLFDDVSFFIGSDDRIGLVGRNGAGKTTLLKVLAGQLRPDKGTIGAPKELTLGYLPQQMEHDLTATPWAVAETAFAEAQRLQAGSPVSSGSWERPPRWRTRWNWRPCWPMRMNA